TAAPSVWRTVPKAAPSSRSRFQARYSAPRYIPVTRPTISAARAAPVPRDTTVTRPSCRRHLNPVDLAAMSYDLTLHCGCVVYVSCHPSTRVAHTRVIQTRGPHCPVRRHDVGARVFLWEILPERPPEGAVAWSPDDEVLSGGRPDSMRSPK